MDKVEEFIGRRFSKDCDWVTGNCYYFAVILKDRFPSGVIYYDVIDGHFLIMIDGSYYDWRGKVNLRSDQFLVMWDRFDTYDKLQKNRIIEDCIK